jgi:hypothetical protein
MTEAPIFDDHEPPAVIVAAAGQWLAERIGGGTRYVKSRREVVRRVGGQRHGITLQTSSWSRTEVGTWVSPRIWVTDPNVAAGQDQRTLTGLFSTGGYIFSTLIINLDLPNSVELFGPLRITEPRPPLSLPEFWAVLQEEILPNLALFVGAPGVAMEQLPDRWLRFPEPFFW